MNCIQSVFSEKKCLRQRLHMFWASRLSSGPSLKLEDCKVNGYSMLRLIAFDFSNPAPFCNSFSKAPSLRTLQSLFSLSIAVSISGFNHSFAFWVFHYYFTRHLPYQLIPLSPIRLDLDSMSTVLSDAFRLALALGVPGHG